MGIKAVIGLGNPGTRYSKTRHNIGFMIVDAFARRESGKKKIFHGEIFEPGKGSYYYCKIAIEGQKIFLVKPTTYMNESGVAVREFADYWKIAPEELLIVLDDFELPFGQIRIRGTGSGGSHNGLSSVIKFLGTENIPRLRFGIDSPAEGMDPADYVLSKFKPDEIKRLKDEISRATNAIYAIIVNGIEKAMGEYNRKITADVTED